MSGEELKLKKGKTGDLVATEQKQLEKFRSKIGFVFQSFNLWPHKTILENIIEGPTQVQKIPKSQAISEAEVLLKRVGCWIKRRLSRKLVWWTTPAYRHCSCVGDETASIVV